MQQNLTEQAYEKILNKIISLEFEPGQRISEKGIENVIKIGRTPVREALLRLRQEELIYVLPQSGTYISKINLDRVFDSILVRNSMENKILQEACDQDYSRLEIFRINQTIEEQRQAAIDRDLTTFLHFNDQFHKQFYMDTHHNFLWNWLTRINIYFYRLTALSLKVDESNWEKSIAEHEQIMKAILNHDKAELKEAFQYHISIAPETEQKIEKQYADYIQH